jgi:hypothetical protein
VKILKNLISSSLHPEIQKFMKQVIELIIKSLRIFSKIEGQF